MSADVVIARGDPITPGLPLWLETLAWSVGIFWVTLCAVLFVAWLVRNRRQRMPEAQALVEDDRREHLEWVKKLRTTGRHRSTDS